MKKIVLITITFVLICFMVPALFTIKKKEKVVNLDNTEEKKEYNYQNYGTIKLLHIENQEIEELPIDEYLYGVVSAEMPATFEMEALKAQAIIARTYTIYKIINNGKHENAHICDNSACCQAWISKEKRFEKWNEEERQNNWQKIVAAVDDTKGKIVTYEGKPINAFFHSNSGGTTEIVSNVWGGTDYPYLKAIQTAGEEAYSQYSSTVNISKEEFTNKIKEYHSDFVINFEEENAIKVLEYTEAGRIKKIKIGNLEISGVEIRTIFSLKSAKFTITIEEENIKIDVIGYGHGVGLSQTGADSLAKEGKSYEEIIKHYYTGVEIENI